jgi:hypothetical protein
LRRCRTDLGLAAQALDHAVGYAWARLSRQIHEALERPPQRAQYAPTVGADADVLLDALALLRRELLVQVVRKVGL